MAAYRTAEFMTHVTCRLTAKNRDQLRNPTLGNRVWAAFTLECFCAGAQSGKFSYTIYVHIFDRGIFLSLDNSYWSKVPERLSPGFTGNCPNVSQCELFAHQSSQGCSDALLDNRRHDSTRRAELYIAARAAWKNRGNDSRRKNYKRNKILNFQEILKGEYTECNSSTIKSHCTLRKA